jgi:hypothetical protein
MEARFRPHMWRARQLQFWRRGGTGASSSGCACHFSVSMCVSTVYGRYHYIADVLAGIAVGAIGLAAGSWLMERKGALAEIAE